MPPGRVVHLMHHACQNEKMLLALISKGDETAFRELYDQYFARVSSYIFTLTKSTFLTEDVIQEVFIKLWTTRSVLIHVESCEAYILSIAKYTTIDWLRKLSRQTNLIADLQHQVHENPHEADLKMNLDSLQHIINSALSQLSPEKQIVFKLSKVRGLSHDEIAHELHLSKSTVKNHLSETLRHIRKNILSRITLKSILLAAILSIL